MERQLKDRIYDTLNGANMMGDYVEGVENLFAPGEDCEVLYSRVMDAYERLCRRLGVQEEDEDVEIIIGCMMDIERRLSCAMYDYGAKFAENT